MKHYFCPICKVKGEQLPGNSLVWYHVATDSKNRPETHKWSINSGRLFSMKATEDDSVV